MSNILYHNRGDGTFKDVSVPSGLPQKGHGLKPFGKTERNLVFAASARFTIVASGSSPISMAVTGVCWALHASESPRSEAKHIAPEERTFTYASIVTFQLEADSCATDFRSCETLCETGDPRVTAPPSANLTTWSRQNNSQRG